jgi:hypothetical protein
MTIIAINSIIPVPVPTIELQLQELESMLLLSHPDVVMLLSLLLPPKLPVLAVFVLAGSVISQGCIDDTEFGAGLLNKFDGEGGGLGEDTRSLPPTLNV